MGGRTAHTLQAEGTNVGFITVTMPHPVARRSRLECLFWVPLGTTGGWYLKELFEYPPQFKIGFMSNNPPLYDTIPEGEMAVKAWIKKHGFGRFQN